LAHLLLIYSHENQLLQFDKHVINYFQLIIKQVEGFIPPSHWIGVVVLFVLLGLTVIMRYYSFGEKLLAIGIVSVVIYVSFLTWAQTTAP